MGKGRKGIVSCIVNDIIINVDYNCNVDILKCTVYKILQIFKI